MCRPKVVCCFIACQSCSARPPLFVPYIRGKLLEKQDETHYARTGNQAEVGWGKDTAIVMGKAEDIQAGAIVHVTGKVAADRSVQARQIVILSGYVQVK